VQICTSYFAKRTVMIGDLPGRCSITINPARANCSSLEDVQRAIAERGLPPELLKPVLQHYSADRLLKPVKQIDGEVANAGT
jgi:hypothetical protein